MFGIGEAIGGAANLAASIAKIAQDNKWRGKAGEVWDDYITQAKNQYSLDPEKAKAFLELSDKSAYQSMDPRAENQANEATQRLLDTGGGEGLDTQSRVALQQGMGQAGAASRAARQAVMANYAQRGTGGSGAELGAALAGNQQAYGELASAGGQAAAAAQQRRLEANTLAGRAAQSQQQLGQQKAAALDTLQRFNVGARQNVLGQQQQATQVAGQGYGGKANAYGGFANNINVAGSPVSNALATAGNVGAGMAKGFASGGGGGNNPIDTSDPNKDWLGQLGQQDA
jgi:hypothetical protein